MKKYFEVNVKCGHVGKNKCINISFSVAANSAKEAAMVARNFKRVKHHHKNAINFVREISFEEFTRINEVNFTDEYLKCENVQSQRLITNIVDRIEDDFYYEDYIYKFEDKTNKRDSVKYRLIKDKLCKLDFYKEMLNCFQEYYIFVLKCFINI